MSQAWKNKKVVNTANPSHTYLKYGETKPGTHEYERVPGKGGKLVRNKKAPWHGVEAGTGRHPKGWYGKRPTKSKPNQKPEVACWWRTAAGGKAYRVCTTSKGQKNKDKIKAAANRASAIRGAARISRSAAGKRPARKQPTQVAQQFAKATRRSSRLRTKKK